MDPRPGLKVSREKYRGISFVNTTATATTQAPSSKRPVLLSRIKFAKGPKARPLRKPVTDDDLRRVQEGEHRRLAPKNSDTSQGLQATSPDAFLVPYEAAAKIPEGLSFQFEPTKSWRQANEADDRSLPRPFGPAIPDWALHGLPVGVSDEGKMCFHAYLYSCPVRHHPFEQMQIISWQPLSRDQSRFDRMVLSPMALKCTLTMGALFLLLRSERRELAGFSMHSARLCALVNDLLGDTQKNTDKQIVIIQSVASLAILASMRQGFLGLQDHWYAHIKGLKLLVEAAGGSRNLPAPVQLLVKQADLKGASEAGIMPLLSFEKFQQPVSNRLPKNHRVAIEAAVRLYVLEDDDLSGILVALAMFVNTINHASSLRGRVVFDPLAVMEDYYHLEYQLLAAPCSIQKHQEPLQRHSSKDPSDMQDVEACLQLALRLAALCYLKLVKRGPRGSLDTSTRIIELLNQSLLYITKEASVDSIRSLDMGALIWICLVADETARLSQSQRGNSRLEESGRATCFKFLSWVLGTSKREGADLVDDYDFGLCRILALEKTWGGLWEPRSHMKEILDRYNGVNGYIYPA
ncbi:hypothetical protein FZEAL_257 [Fusarium zealandicum]|uniref:Uncharacterized protein n=1 Tax=Fusarium zealandicum TaxID=1053134 RepID=A0A8H4UUZ2_9HYPO|nr:hypothetical protein FZEAL_257 [Fusarium zealandicum]